MFGLSTGITCQFKCCITAQITYFSKQLKHALNFCSQQTIVYKLLINSYAAHVCEICSMSVNIIKVLIKQKRPFCVRELVLPLFLMTRIPKVSKDSMEQSSTTIIILQISFFPDTIKHVPYQATHGAKLTGRFFSHSPTLLLG